MREGGTGFRAANANPMVAATAKSLEVRLTFLIITLPFNIEG
jgi:hypothetical protein